MSGTEKNDRPEEKKEQAHKEALHLNINSKTYNAESIVKLTAEIESHRKSAKSQLKSTMKGKVAQRILIDLIKANIKLTEESKKPKESQRESEKIKRINEQWGSYGGGKSKKEDSKVRIERESKL